MYLDRSPHSIEQFQEFAEASEEYISLGKAEQFPVIDLQKPTIQVFYMQYTKTHVTTKVRIVSDASANPALACHSMTH